MGDGYFILPFGLDEDGKAKLSLFRQNCSAALDIIASDERCVVLAGPSREPDATARILAALGLSESKQAAESRIAHARAEWLDFRLAVARPSGTKGDVPIPLANAPTNLQITNYRELFDAKGPNGGRHRGDPFLWFWRLQFCELVPSLVTTEDQHKAEYVLLSNRPEDTLLSGSARPRPWHLKRVYATTDAQGCPAVGIEFDDTAAKLMGTLTEGNIGRPLAVLFHDNVLSVLTIETKITDKLLISGGKFDKSLVDKIVRSLSECMLAENEIVRTVTRPATQPAFDRWGSLELAMRQYNKGADPAEDASLKRLEDALRENIKNGWKPPWSDLELKLTDKEIAPLSTAEICVKLFDGGLPARTLMLYNSANAGIKRLEVLYAGYRDLFHREDCWKGLVASMDYYAAQLNVRAQGTANVNAITGLMTVPKFYSYPPIRANIAGHQRELIAAHVRALKALKAYLDASASASGTDKAKPFFATMTPCVLVDWALVLGHDLSEQQYRSACTALSRTKWDGRTTDSDLLAYIDEAIVVLEHFVRIPTTTQHESSQETGDSIQNAPPVTMPAKD